MLLVNKNAVVYGGGAVGGAIARAFAREGAKVFLAGRTLAALDDVAHDIVRAGGVAETAQLDAHDLKSVEDHLDEVAHRAGSIDVCLNAINLNEVQGIPLVEMSQQDFLTPITEAARTHFVTSTAAARRMAVQGSGVILLLSSSAARESEVGRQGVRVVALRPNFISETAPGVPLNDIQYLIDGTALGCLPRLAEVADTAAFLASARAGAMTGAVVNLTCGAIVDCPRADRRSLRSGRACLRRTPPRPAGTPPACASGC